MKKLYIFIVLIFLFSTSVNQSKAQVNVQDSLALVDLYNSTNGAGWINKTNWLTGKVINWYGVSVDGNYRVVNLNLPKNNLVGTIPLSIGNLTGLYELKLYSNQLRGTLPSSIGNLTKLEILWVYSNNFNGEIPNSIGNLANLVNLKINSNAFSGAIPSSLNNLVNLGLLEAQNNNFTALPVFTLNATLFFSDNYLSFEDMLPNISKNIGSSQKIIGTSRNKLIKTAKTDTIQLNFDKNTSGNYYIWFKDNQQIAQTSVNYLTIVNAAATDAGTYKCSVKNTNFPGITLYTAPVNVSIQPPTELEIDSLALVDLYKSTNGPNWANKTNWLTGPLTTWYGITLLNRRVTAVSLTNNNLVGQIPSTISNLSKLVTFSLGNNKLSGVIPNTITKLSSLTTLRLNNNLLSGNLPLDLGNLTNLLYFELFQNQLTGSIPFSIGSLQKLRSLNLSKNILSGEIPLSIGNLKELQYLSLAENNLEGSVPSSIGNLNKLFDFYINDNKLTSLPLLPASIPKRGCIQNNYFSFDDILPNLSRLLTYSPQRQSHIGQKKTINYCDSVVLSLKVDSNITTNRYMWRRNLLHIATTNSNKYVIKNATNKDAGSYICIVVNSNTGNANIVFILDTIVVKDIAIVEHPVNQTVCEGSEVTYKIRTSRNNLNYQWQRSYDAGISWNDIPGEKDTILSINADISKNNYLFRCSANTSCGVAVTSNSANLIVHSLPKIFSSTPSDTVCENSPLALSVTATDTSGVPLTYQWQKYVPNQWENIVGETTSVFNLTALPEINKSYYRCVVTGLCSTNSEPAQISVKNVPVIHSQPADATVCQGTSTGFLINATGKDSTYQWQVSSDNGTSWADITGEQKNYLEVEGAVSNNGMLYRCIVSGSCGSPAVSEVASLTLITDPVIIAQPVSQTVTEGDATAFSIGATGTNLTYVWQSNTNGTWVNIPQANTSSFQKTVSLSDAGGYRCIINNLCYSQPVDLMVAEKPVIINQPVGQTVLEGKVASFSVTAAGPDLSYQWQKYEEGNWTEVPEATSQTFKVSASSAVEGEYRCRITNFDNVAVFSNSAALRRCSAPVINDQPTDQNICEGSPATFHVSASDASSYQWQVKLSGSNTWDNVPGAINTTYSFTSTPATSGNSYRCLISRSCGSSATSLPALLTVNKTTITTQPLNNALCDGDQASFSVGASGLNLNYQWQQLNGTWSNISGAVNSSYALPVISGLHRKYYRCVVSGTCGSVSSKPVLLTMGPQVIGSLADETSCTGATATFGDILAIGSGTLNYQWQQSSDEGATWAFIDNATGKNYSTAVTDASNGNLYRCLVSGCGYADTSSSAALIVKNTHIEQQPSSVTVCEGNETGLNIMASGVELNYQWAKSSDGTNWNVIQGATGNSLKVPVTSDMDQQKFICRIKGTCDVNWIDSEIAILTANQNTISPLIAVTGNVTCEAGSENGSITVDPIIGGQSPYTYKWSNGSSSRDLESLAVGDYSLTVSDDAGCNRTITKTINYDAPISSKMKITDVAIPGTASGTIEPGISGGHQPLTFQWSNNTTNEMVTGLLAGNYMLTVTDNENCVKTFSATISEMGSVAYIDPSELPDPETRQLDKTLSVGTIAGEAGISPSGAATYSIPIEMLPGVGSMVPQLSLNYNSQAGNGIMGWGWNIAGLSAITRTQRTIYSDTFASGMQLNINDGLALNGNRLIPIKGTYGEDGSVYVLENETFDTIIAHGNYGNTGPEWFEVKAKNGLRYTYGSDSVSRLLYNCEKYTVINKAIIAWNLDSVIDLNGNYTHFVYQQDRLNSYLIRINYGGNLEKNTSNVNSIVLSYALRQDTLPVHYGDLKGSINLLLSNILITNEGDVYRSYSMHYIKDDFSRLVSISESNKDGEKFNPTIFRWGEKDTTVVSEDVYINLDPNVDISDQDYVNGDFNGDGLTDLVSIYKKDGNKARVYYSKNNDAGKVDFAMGELLSLGDEFLSSGRRGSYSRRGTSNFGDLDGDNKTEIIVPEWSNNSGSSVKFIIYFNENENQVYQRYPTSKLLASSEKPVYAIGDLNNDGFDEIVYIERGWGDLDYCPGKIYLPQKNTWIDFNVYYNGEKPDRMVISDFDGDGMQDIMVLCSKGYWIYKNNGGDLAAAFKPSNQAFKGGITSLSNFQLGDFNGDGLIDILKREIIYGNTSWGLYINSGSDMFFHWMWVTILSQDDVDTKKDDDKDNFHVTDFNNDGKSDLIVTDAKYHWKHNWGSSWKEFDHMMTHWYKSNGNTFELVGSSRSIREDDAYAKRSVTGDFNGDGRTELMYYGYDCNGLDKTQKWRLYGNPNL